MTILKNTIQPLLRSMDRVHPATYGVADFQRDFVWEPVLRRRLIVRRQQLPPPAVPRVRDPFRELSPAREF